jgi:hypothetical protein
VQIYDVGDVQIDDIEDVQDKYWRCAILSIW